MLDSDTRLMVLKQSREKINMKKPRFAGVLLGERFVLQGELKSTCP
jgi:hypothetical protein